MAGIGEASAIIAVAQAGIGLSRTIIAFIGDVRDAPNTVVRIGNEIQTTSGRLREIGALIEDNRDTKLFSDEGVSDAARCSYECDLILAQVGNLLIKGGWRKDVQAWDKSDIDISLFSALRWPFLKSRLETPRAELQIIKADLNLLFSSAMARRSSNPLTSEFAQDIPRLTRTREWAARKAEKARQASRNSVREEDWQPHSMPSEPPKKMRDQSRRPSWKDDDPEIYQRFVAFEQQKIREREDRKAQERAAVLQAEIERKRNEEGKERKMIELRAVEEYKRQQEEIQQQQHVRETALRQQLVDLGLEKEQVESVLAIPNINSERLQDLQQATRSTIFSNEKLDHSQSPVASQSQRAAGSEGRNGIRNFLGLSQIDTQDSDARKINLLETPSLDNLSNNNSNAVRSNLEFEHWLVDFVSQQHTELAMSHKWMNKKLSRLEKRDDVWQRMAQLQPTWRNAIQQFLKSRNQGEPPEAFWKPIDVSLPRRMIRPNILGHKRDGQLVRLILARQCHSVQDTKSTRGSQKLSASRTTSEKRAEAEQLIGQGESESQLPPNQENTDEKMEGEVVTKKRKGVSFAPIVNTASNSQQAPGEDETDSGNSSQGDDVTKHAKQKSSGIPSVYVLDYGGGYVRDCVTYLPRDFVTTSALDFAGLQYEKDFEKPIDFPDLDTRDYIRVLKEVDPDTCGELINYGGGGPESFEIIETRYEYQEGQLEESIGTSAHEIPERAEFSHLDRLRESVDAIRRRTRFSVIPPSELEELHELDRRLKFLSERLEARPLENTFRRGAMGIPQESRKPERQSDADLRLARNARNTYSLTRRGTESDLGHTDPVAETYSGRRTDTRRKSRLPNAASSLGTAAIAGLYERQKSRPSQKSKPTDDAYHSAPHIPEGSAYGIPESPLTRDRHTTRYTDDYQPRASRTASRRSDDEKQPVMLWEGIDDDGGGEVSSKDHARRRERPHRSNSGLVPQRKPQSDDDGIRVRAEPEVDPYGRRLLTAGAWNEEDGREGTQGRNENPFAYPTPRPITQSPPPIRPRTGLRRAGYPPESIIIYNDFANAETPSYKDDRPKSWDDNGSIEYGDDEEFRQYYSSERSEEERVRRRRRRHARSDTSDDDGESLTSLPDHGKDADLIAKTLQKYTDFKADDDSQAAVPPPPTARGNLASHPFPVAGYRPPTNEAEEKTHEENPLREGSETFPVGVRFAEEGMYHGTEDSRPQDHQPPFASIDRSTVSRQTTFDTTTTTTTTVSSSTNDMDDLRPVPADGDAKTSGHGSADGMMDTRPHDLTDPEPIEAVPLAAPATASVKTNGHAIDSGDDEDQKWGSPERTNPRSPTVQEETEENLERVDGWKGVS